MLHLLAGCVTKLLQHTMAQTHCTVRSLFCQLLRVQLLLPAMMRFKWKTLRAPKLTHGTLGRRSNTWNVSSCKLLRSCLNSQRSMWDCGLPSVHSHSYFGVVGLVKQVDRQAGRGTLS